MRRSGKWVLTLGLVATLPTVASAGPFSFLRGGRDTEQATTSQNQKVAENIATALRSARVQGRDVEIEFQNGVAVLYGITPDAGQKARATQAASHVPGVNNVDNRMRISAAAQPLASPQPSTRPQRAIIQASAANPIGSGPKRTFATQPAIATRPAPTASSAAPKSAAPATPVAAAAPAGPSNQQMAQKIADALSARKLKGYDIEIRYQDGVALLGGQVSSPQQWQAASQAASTVPGVRRVVNQMQVAQAQMPPQGRAPIRPAGYQPMPNGAAPVPPMPAYGHAGGASFAAYNSPNMPEYAWPSYASYPNYAQVTYPQQYSASAWPYIGPFYPYPQVPLGWRKASLEWDDGQWNLSFNPRTDKWFWFMNPKHWN